MEWLEAFDPLIVIDIVTEWLKIIAPFLVPCVLFLGACQLLFRLGHSVRRGMNGTVMSERQIRAEKEAIQKLNSARKMLEQDSSNLQEAQSLRLDVTHHLLPSHHMYIVGQHPRSLLRDVDKRIRQAYIEQLSLGAVETAIETPRPLYTTRVDNSRTQSKSVQTKSRPSSQSQFWTIAVILTCGIVLIALLVYFGQYANNSALKHSFSWIKP